MPYDGDIKQFDRTLVPTARPFDFDAATPNERLLELAGWLERQDLWEGRLLEWDFTYPRAKIEHSCGTAGCAIGLADILWPQAGFEANSSRWNGANIMDAFGLDEYELVSLFTSNFADERGLEMNEVTPAMVAAAIQDLVAKRQS